MDLITTRGVFGDYGRLAKGQVVKDVPKQQAEKMIKSGGYTEATADAVKSAKASKKVTGAKLKGQAKGGGTASVDSRAIDAAVEAALKKLREEFAEAIQKAGQTLASISEDVEVLRTQIADGEKRHAEEIAKISAAITPAGGANEAPKSST